MVLEDKVSGNSFVLGEECHIISSKIGGPRSVNKDDLYYDSLENLILLCPNHHSEVDKNTDFHTVERLINAKQQHEVGIAINLKQPDQPPNKKPTLLHQIKTGKELVDIVRGAHAFQFDHDEFASEEEAELVGGLLQDLQDWGDLLPEIGMAEVAKLSYQLNSTIQILEDKGFVIFGDRKESKMTNEKKEDLGKWQIATVAIIRKTNPAITKMPGV